MYNIANGILEFEETQKIVRRKRCVTNLLASNRFEYHYYSFSTMVLLVSFDKKKIEAGGNSTFQAIGAPLLAAVWTLVNNIQHYTHTYCKYVRSPRVHTAVFAVSYVHTVPKRTQNPPEAVVVFGVRRAIQVPPTSTGTQYTVSVKLLCAEVLREIAVLIHDQVPQLDKGHQNK